jgi:hypothetical protein
MKTLIALIILIVSIPALSQEACHINETSKVSEIKEDINTPIPKSLEDATIIVKTKDGKTKEMKASEFKVVPRKQQFKVKERVVVQRVECQPKVITKEVDKDTNKNLVALGVSKGYSSLEKEETTNSASLYYKKDLIIDLLYMRRQVFETNFGLGFGVDTNTTLKGYLGYEF